MTKATVSSRLIKPCACLGLLLLAPMAPAVAAGDAAAGADVYRAECADCHSLTAGKNKKGASFIGVIGRTAGTVPGAKYSDAMKASKIVWTPERIDAYITNPKKVVPGGTMKYDGLPSAKDREDVIAFIVSKN